MYRKDLRRRARNDLISQLDRRPRPPAHLFPIFLLPMHFEVFPRVQVPKQPGILHSTEPYTFPTSPLPGQHTHTHIHTSLCMGIHILVIIIYHKMHLRIMRCRALLQLPSQAKRWSFSLHWALRSRCTWGAPAAFPSLFPTPPHTS